MELFSVQTFLFSFLISLYLYFYFNTSTKKTHKKPGPKIYPIVGVLPDFWKNRHRFLDWLTEILRDRPTNTNVIWSPIKGYVFVTANPSNVEHMLKTNFENYPKGNCFTTLLEDFLGHGIFNSDGELWKIQRKTASYEFNTKSLRNFIMKTSPLRSRFAFDNICKLAFNFDPSCLSVNGTGASEFMRAFEEATTICSERFLDALPFIAKFKKFLNIGSERRLKKSVKIVHEFADKIIRSRMGQKMDDLNNFYGLIIDNEKDLLSRFMSNEENSPEFLRDIVISLILAGRDTTSSSLSWFFWLLSSHPNVEQNILKELETIRVRYRKNIGETYSYDELHDMHYLHAAISEALRLYPPLPADTKTCLNDDIMPDGTFVRKGWQVTYHMYGMGKMESIWGKNCLEFFPERWIENGVFKHESPFQFAVFQAGLRICLGRDMAYIQMKSIAASMMERFEMEVKSKGKVPEYLLAFTLRMKLGGLPLRVRKRCINEINWCES
ncbi:hypothetical protein ACB092_02G028900 [Castanea dentata]